MKSVTRVWITVSLFLSFLSPELQAQDTDTLRKYQDTTAVPTKASFFKSKGFRATIVPAILIGYGVSTIKDHGIYSSYDAKRDLQRHFPNFKTNVDDYLIFAPFAELALAYVLQFEGNHDYLNTGILILKAEAINAVAVFGLKSLTKQERPNGENSYSFPSGHTAHAFLAASIIHSELRHRSPWFGIGAYTIATGVGALRMLNNKHWQSDVFAGAGIGILSSHLAYLSHRNRWGRKPTIVYAPTYLYGVPGVSVTVDLNQLTGKSLLPVKRPKKQAVLAYQ
ncbi:phosphatase PAP2 family protein [Adhaeribacter swui]|uniref:Phosphatase PAP2 family protein n=1 Tax=Adhaeribacter swui TaxID=2086471 RepID=A0A7G7GBS9_9BACT|nr:phosphatase PAP2 family protein [Adhaeribacter swui]QNF34613.1 phosphatase PAP2 family protein [Adhaeribacter swui]